MEELSYKIQDFEGPLDLLLQLIAKNKVNIIDVNLSDLVDQYLEQIEHFKKEEMDISSDFLTMASRLLYIKTVSLLPKHDEADQLVEELKGELMEYQICRQMAEKLSRMTVGFDRFIKKPCEYDFDKTYELTHDPQTMLDAYISAVGRGKRKLPPNTAPFTKIVARKIFAVSSKIVFVMRNLMRGGKKKMSSLYSGAKSRSELVATFLAILELCKANRVTITGNNMEETEIELIKEHKK
ncbi:MAG: segregation/condensation protein A [Clostridia bacterium]|nr:segregation/condensation protein A [Clostridia bacterium]